GFGVLLTRLAGADVTLGVAGEGRTYEGLDRALGAFARDLPVTIASDGAAAFGDVIDATHRALAAQLEQQESFALDRVPGGSTASFDLGFAVEDWRLDFEARDAVFSIEGHWTCNQRCMLRLVVARETHGTVLELYHDAGRVARADAERL